MKHKRALIRRLISALTILVLMSSLLPCTVSAEEQSWDCPNCGRKGNIGNFCGSCAQPKPTPAPSPTDTPKPEPTPEILKIRKVVYDRENLNATVIWTGGTAPVTLSVYHYFNENHNEGIKAPFKLEHAWLDSDSSDSIGELIPGQRYWIRLTDSAGRKEWYDYTVPERKIKYSVKVKSASCYTITFQDGSGSVKLIRDFSAAKLKKEAQLEFYSSDGDHYGMEVKLHFDKISSDKQMDVAVFNAVILPNGDLIPGNRNGWGWSGSDVEMDNDCFAIWKRIYSKYGTPPIGTYTFIFGLEGSSVLVRQKFTVTK